MDIEDTDRPGPIRSARRNGSSVGQRMRSRLHRSRFCQRLSSFACSQWLWKRISFGWEHGKLEWILLKTHWKILLLGAVFQYVHKVATNVAYYMHVRLDPLQDLGFMVLPALSRQMQISSEILFFAIAISTGVFALSPFFLPHTNTKTTPRYTIVMCARFLMVCASAQTLRIICFLITSLPGPNYHCRPGSPDYNPPANIKEIFFRGDVFYNCGDLIFSSHTIFMTLCALSLVKYWPLEGWPRRLLAGLIVFFGLIVISARKHYSVDVFIALYTVPLLWLVYDQYFPDKIPLELTSVALLSNGTGTGHAAIVEESEGLTDDFDAMEAGDIELDLDLDSSLSRNARDTPLWSHSAQISSPATSRLQQGEEAISL